VDSGWQYMFPYTIFGKAKMFLVKNKFQYWNTDCAHLKNLKIFLKVSFPMTWKNSEQCDDRTWIISSNVSRHSRDRCSTHIQNQKASTLMVTKLKFGHNVLVYWISSVMKFSDLTCLKIKLHKYVCTNAWLLQGHSVLQDMNTKFVQIKKGHRNKARWESYKKNLDSTMQDVLAPEQYQTQWYKRRNNSGWSASQQRQKGPIRRPT
jgi:hypothetical protein